MRPWQFRKPKTSGFGIDSVFYLSVLSSKPVMPSLPELVEPSGLNGAVVGFGAPLAAGATKESLRQPLERGAYALATKDRKTVLKMLVMSKEEAQFDPEYYARSPLATSASAETLARVRATWTLAQLTFESHDPMVYPALDFLLQISQRLSEQTDGVVADTISRRYLLPSEVLQPIRLDPQVDARELVSVNLRQGAGGIKAFTLGMQKFSLPELEVLNLFREDTEIAARMLYAVCQNTLLGDLAKNGDRFGATSLPFEARNGGFDTELWGPTPVLELLPPTASTASEALAAWELQMSSQHSAI